MPKQEKKFRNQNYGREWEKEAWAKGWLSCSKSNPTKAFCSFCKKKLVSGKSVLLGHSKSSLHVRNAKTVQGTQPITASITSKDSSIIKAELNIVALIASKNVSFNFLDSLLETLHGIAVDSTAVKGITCNLVYCRARWQITI